MKHSRALALIRLAARLALLGLALQLSAFGHWSFGPFHADDGDMASHAAHCHGDLSGCAGESSLTGSLLEANLTPAVPAPHLSALPSQREFPAELFIEPAEKPPRAPAGVAHPRTSIGSREFI